MPSEHLIRDRKRVGYVMLGVFGLLAAWYFTPGIPVLMGPWASAHVKEAGKVLFEHEWQPNDPLAGGDGLGPVFNDRSCVACHFQGGVGGGGSVKHNVLTYEIHPTRNDPEVHHGVIHAMAVDKSSMETEEKLRKIYRVVGGQTTIVCGRPVKAPDFDPVRTESINPPALFGAGWIDRISTKAITNNRMRRLLANSTKELEHDFFSALPVGRLRVLADGRIGKFGWKAQFATLEEFVAEACAGELGLGNPLKDQAKPMGSADGTEVAPDLDRKQMAAMAAFVDTLPRPVEILPEDTIERDQAVRGKELFGRIGCAACHTPDLNGVKGVYSDFLLYKIEPPGGPGTNGYGPEPQDLPPIPADHPLPSEWKTPPLWGVADSAPYFHDGHSPTLADAILRHGGDAEKVRKAYRDLAPSDREAMIAFLKTLKAPPDAAAVSAQVAQASK